MFSLGMISCTFKYLTFNSISDINWKDFRICGVHDFKYTVDTGQYDNGRATIYLSAYLFVLKLYKKSKLQKCLCTQLCIPPLSTETRVNCHGQSIPNFTNLSNTSHKGGFMFSGLWLDLYPAVLMLWNTYYRQHKHMLCSLDTSTRQHNTSFIILNYPWSMPWKIGLNQIDWFYWKQ